MSFNIGSFNRLPFNRSPSIPIVFEAVFDTSLDVQFDGLEVISGLAAKFDTTLDIDTAFTRVVSFETNFDTSLEINSIFVIKRDLYGAFASSLDLRSKLTRIVYFESDFDTTLDMQADFFTGRKQEAQTNVVLQPNDILVINSCDYTVTLNGKNAFESYGGDWIFLEEGSIDLILSSNSGGKAEVKIDVVPRWL